MSRLALPSHFFTLPSLDLAAPCISILANSLAREVAALMFCLGPLVTFFLSVFTSLAVFRMMNVVVHEGTARHPRTAAFWKAFHLSDHRRRGGEVQGHAQPGRSPQRAEGSRLVCSGPDQLGSREGARLGPVDCTLPFTWHWAAASSGCGSPGAS